MIWLYGPLQSVSDKPPRTPPSTPCGDSRVPNNLFAQKKPILKRRSTQEMMLQKSVSSSAVTSPSWSEEKHIHFNEQVEQCLALDGDGYDRDSDDGAVMMKDTYSNRKLPVSSGSDATQISCNVHSKTIAMLPPIRLKHTEGTPEPSETVANHRNRF